MPSNIEKLKQALAEMIRFLEETKSEHWAGILKGIDEQLSNPRTVELGRRELECCFGGMSSLNDLYFSERNGNLPAGYSADQANAEFDR
jgi:hypothetical protein